MKLIKPSAEIIKPTGYTIDDIYKSIELVGKVCHKSENTITEDSAKKFVDRMMKMKHLSTCEFGTVYLQFFWPGKVCQKCNQIAPHKLLDKYADNKYSRVNYHGNDVYVTTNLRVLIENNWLDDLKYLCEPTKYHEKRICVKFICDRGILAEFTRHRKFSFMAESTRYCNYSQDKFNNEITYIIPCWMNLEEGSYNNGKYYNPIATPYLVKGTTEEIFLLKLVGDELDYFELLEKGWKPQQARAVLPSALKTELYMCGFVEDWKKFFELRCAANAHPQARELAIPLHEEFKNKNYIV